MRDSPAKETFEAKLETAKAEGTAGRKELLDKLARMPMEQVIALPAGSLAILGPSGLAKLAAMREDLAGTERRPDAGGSQAKAPAPEKAPARRSRNPVLSSMLIVAVLLAAGPLIDLARPMLSAAFLDESVRLVDTSRWPACRRIDRHVDGCVYRTGSAFLTLGTVSTLAGIPVEEVLAVNKHLSVLPDTTLDRGSPIVIWRGRMQLEGGSR